MATTVLERSLEEAEMLIAYVARNGILIRDEEVLKGITTTREKMTASTLSASDEAKFYEWYTQLAHIVSPVSVDSLKACILEKDFPRRFRTPYRETPAARTVRT